MDRLLFALWFFIPAGLANAAPVLVAKIPILQNLTAPLDGGKKLNGRPLFGKNKTWRGLFSGIVVATLAVALQKYLFTNYQSFRELSNYIDYASLNIWVVGPLFGAGALLGDALESLIKRQMNITAGDAWFPFDQTDYILGSLLTVAPFVRLSPGDYLLVFLVWFALHIITSYAAYLIGLKNKPI